MQNIYDMKGMTLIGSMGQAYPMDTSTQGGGHVHIHVDSLELSGAGVQIKADGIPWLNKNDDPADLNGGSGGYIFIKTANKDKPNVIDTKATVSAQGGFGKNKGLGGAGGVVVLDTGLDPQSFDSVFKVNGGTGGSASGEARPCATGASGTVYFTRNDFLHLSNDGYETSRPTKANLKPRNVEVYG
jgi:hypothetical protein